MIAGPQIVSAVFLATSQRWAANSVAYIGGAAVSVTTVVTIAYVTAPATRHAAGHAHAGTADRVIDSVVLRRRRPGTRDQ